MNYRYVILSLLWGLGVLGLMADHPSLLFHLIAKSAALCSFFLAYRLLVYWHNRNRIPFISNILNSDY